MQKNRLYLSAKLGIKTGNQNWEDSSLIYDTNQLIGKGLKMAVHLIKQGLDLPINGSPEARIDEGARVTRVAILADDYPLMKPRMHVTVGDTVKRGQLLFEDRKAEGVHFTAPGAGTVVAINRGDRRALQSLVIELDDAARNGEGEQVDFEHYTGADPSSLDGEAVRRLLVESGLWTAIKARPFGRVPSSGDSPSAIFVTAMDTRPLSGSVETAVAGRNDDLAIGLNVLKTLTEGEVYLCTAAESSISAPEGIRLEQFEGKHPAGLPGTHIHVLHPVHRERSAWHLDVQDAIAMGHLARTGILDVQRIIAIGGPVVYAPRLLKTRLGASIDELVNNEIRKDLDVRVISGSPLGGRASAGDVHGYLGRYHAQVSCIAEDRERVFLGWLSPGFGKFSTIRAFASGLLGLNTAKRDFTTSTNGSHRAMVPIGMFERVMPLDIMPTFLLRALSAGDLERAESLGCLELDEEDLSLCTFVAPGKEDFGKALRRSLDEIWKEG